MSSKSSRTGSQVSKLHKTSYAQSGKGEDWLDRLARFNKHFGRFARDVGGVVLLALALMSLLALLRLTKGALLIPWADWLSCWFGWGSYLLVLTVGFGGWFLLRRVGGRPGWGQFIAIELAVFLSMALLDAVFGHSLEWAEAGLYGGRLGWGLVELIMRFLGPIWTLVLVILVWILTFVSGLGLWSWLETRLLTLAGESLPSTVAPPVMDKHIGRSPVAADVHTTKKRVASLPPEFRKSLRAPDSQDQRPAAPIPRGERLPPLTLLVGEQSSRPDERTINQIAGLIEKTLAEFGIPTRVVGFRIGPSVTQFAVEPGFIERSGSVEGDAQRLKVRVAQIASLQRDLALALSAERLRIEAPVPGRSYVGIEVPNSRTSIVRLRPLLETEAFYRINSPLAIALGRDVSGQPVVADLARMPHLLIAGATGSGKSVCITALATCLAMNNTPEDLRLVMIDSKMVELLRFNGLSHLYGKVETDIQRILGVLRWVVVEMEHRYRLLEAARARDIDLYNRRIQRRREGMPLPRIVVMIDEMADLMMSAPDQTEHNLVRLAQMARATGIHLVVATQRPSVDVVTGLIKANFPARASFAVASSVDSRVVLDMAGAENLLGRGDMLFLNPEVGGPVRVQGVMVADQEVERLINHWQKTPPEIEEPPPWEKLLSRPVEEDDALIEQAISVFRDTQRASASLLQRRLRIGYPRAARLLDQLEELGVVGPSQGGGREREVLVGQDEDNDIEA
jgi:S-DNA-T family DNA segregation ATPase FtsK/SpoIIIE